MRKPTAFCAFWIDKTKLQKLKKGMEIKPIRRASVLDHSDPVNALRNGHWLPERGLWWGRSSVSLRSLPPFVRGHLTPKF